MTHVVADAVPVPASWLVGMGECPLCAKSGHFWRVAVVKQSNDIGGT
jgi:hypothetical protein